MNYTLRLPFTVASSTVFKPGHGQIVGHAAELDVSERWHVLQVRGLGDEAAARGLLQQLVAGLVWVALEWSTGIKLDPDPQEIYVLDKPAVDTSPLVGATAVAEEGRPVIWREDQRVSIVGAMPVHAYTSIAVERFYESLQAGATLPRIERLVNDARTSLAVEILMSSYFEASPFSAFLARCTVLEVLTSSDTHPEPIPTMVDEWTAALRDLEREGRVDAKRAASVQGALGQVKRESIKFAVRKLITRQLGPEASQEAAKLYDMRSEIIHEGAISRRDTALALPRLTSVVRDLIRSLLA